jgi:hypothetical protein
MAIRMVDRSVDGRQAVGRRPSATDREDQLGAGHRVVEDLDRVLIDAAE